jgi:hypothetical protein
MSGVRFPATILLIAANIVAFGFELSRTGSGLLMGGVSIQALVDAGALVPVLV